MSRYKISGYKDAGSTTQSCILKEHVLHLRIIRIHNIYTHKHIYTAFATICCESLWKTKTAPAAPTASSGSTLWPPISIDSYTYKCYHDMNAWMGIIAMLSHLLVKLKDCVPGAMCKLPHHQCARHTHALCNAQLQECQHVKEEVDCANSACTRSAQNFGGNNNN